MQPFLSAWSGRHLTGSRHPGITSQRRREPCAPPPGSCPGSSAPPMILIVFLILAAALLVLQTVCMGPGRTQKRPAVSDAGSPGMQPQTACTAGPAPPGRPPPALHIPAPFRAVPVQKQNLSFSPRLLPAGAVHGIIQLSESASGSVRAPDFCPGRAAGTVFLRGAVRRCSFGQI